ncbi:MAG: hypothetical protein K8R36_02170, partial [Planctomycetales bacterium]|nr:hypothetical protein [Planctomycetales bacterium]
EETPRDSNVWLWMAWLADSPAAMAHCLEHLLAEQPDHPVAQDGLRWARGLMKSIADDATGSEFNKPEDEIEFNWPSIVEASPAAPGGCESHAVEILGVAIAAVEELILDINPPPCYEEGYDELPSQPTAPPLPVNTPPAGASLADLAPTDAPLAETSLLEADLPELTLAAPELLEAPLTNALVANDSCAEPGEFLTDESSDDSPLVELLLGDSLPTSPLVNAITELPESREKLLESPQSFAAGDARADGEVQFDLDADVQIDAVHEAPVVLLPLAVETEPELLLVESQPAATSDQFLEPASLELPAQPASQELQSRDVPEDAPVVDFAVEGSQLPVTGPIDGSPSHVEPLSTKEEASSSAEHFAGNTEPVPSELDNHCILHLRSLEQQISLLHNPTDAEGRQQTLQAARVILADTLEFLQVTERQELLLRNRDEICRVHEEIKKVDQLLEWPSLWGLLGLRTAAKQTPLQAYIEVGVGFAALLDTLLTQIGTTLPTRSQVSEWEVSFRPLLADMQRRW